MSRDSRVDMRHDLQYYYGGIIWQLRYATNKEQRTVYNTVIKSYS